jgi:hypothetical protein
MRVRFDDGGETFGEYTAASTNGGGGSTKAAEPPNRPRNGGNVIAGGGAGGIDSEGDRPMRSNSGAGKGSNNNHNPTLRTAEKEKGVSGTAVHGNKLNDATPKRGSTRKSSP